MYSLKLNPGVVKNVSFSSGRLATILLRFFRASSNSFYAASAASFSFFSLSANKNYNTNTLLQKIKSLYKGIRKVKYATKKELKKISQQALTEARVQVGSKREPVKITDREWEAIQSGAISPTKLKQIIDNSDLDRLRELATPRSSKNTISPAKENKIKAMIASGYTNAEIADAIGVSSSTVAKYIKGGREE